MYDIVSTNKVVGSTILQLFAPNIWIKEFVGKMSVPNVIPKSVDIGLEIQAAAHEMESVSTSMPKATRKKMISVKESTVKIMKVKNLIVPTVKMRKTAEMI